MLFGILTLITALAIAGVAAWFSIAGLMAIFSAAATPIAVMAGTLEVGKLLTASFMDLGQFLISGFHLDS